MALKILKALQKTPSIKFMIHKSLAGWEAGRDDGYVHASDLMRDQEFCPREWVLRHIHEIKPKGEFISTAMAITFNHGRDVEYNVRNKWLKNHVVGNWVCDVCGAMHPTFGKYPKVACTCGHKRWIYSEFSFHSPYSGVGGSIDAIVDVGATKHPILEIKSMDKDEFKALKAPKAEHKARTSLYMRLAEESGLNETECVDVKKAHILYVAKAFGIKDDSLSEAGIKDAAFSPFKEFIIERDDSLTDTVINRARVVYLAKQDPTLGVPCGICSTGLEKRAQSCSALKPCWTGQHPNVITWLENGKPRHMGKVVL